MQREKTRTVTGKPCEMEGERESELWVFILSKFTEDASLALRISHSLTLEDV